MGPSKVRCGSTVNYYYLHTYIVIIRHYYHPHEGQEKRLQQQQ